MEVPLIHQKRKECLENVYTKVTIFLKMLLHQIHQVRKKKKKKKIIKLNFKKKKNFYN